jgi:hypothetical protein
MVMLDVFNSDAFSVTNLTDAINKVKFVPGRIGQLGIFQGSGVTTTAVAIEEKDGILELISPSARGEPGGTLTKNRRTLRNLTVPHFEIEDAIMAEEVQGVRAWGSETEVETVAGKVMERGSIHSQSFAATQEYSRIGAVKGIVTYADGSTLNLYTEFGVSQITEVDWDLDNTNPVGGALRKKCAETVREMAGVLEGIPFSGLHAFCGDAFFDDLIAHPEVRDTYIGWTAAQELRQGYVQGGLSTFVNTDKCHIFPLGVPGLFRCYYAPADYIETVNTMGQRLYMKQYIMPNGKGVHLDTQMNALDICTRPRALLQGRRT